MRRGFSRTVLAALIWAAGATASFAIPYIPPPAPVEEAPIDRALENVARMENLEPAQREQLLGRLNLLAYLRNDALVAYMREDGQFHEPGVKLCNDVLRDGTHGDPDAPPPVFGPEEKCALWTFDLRPQEEIAGEPPAAPSDAARARLVEAARHYRRALELDATNLRARLGYAYALDRQGQRDAARRELRALLHYGLPKLRNPNSEWDDHTVLTEAAAQLGQLATTRRDRRDMERLRARLQASQPMIYMTPVFVPLTDAPFERLVARESRVAFDFAGNGRSQAHGWLRPNAAWLVWDPGARGGIRSGLDLIGSRTWAVFWRDGFEVLRALDDNADGELTDGELGGLALWRDANGNGVSEDGEVQPLSAHGIVALATRSDAQAPDLLTARNGVRFEDGRVRPLYDWTPRRTPVS